MEFSEPVRYGITSDGSRINQYGVSVITYGAGFGTHLVDPDEQETGSEWDRPSGTRRGVGIRNMERCSSVYALAALDICSKTPRGARPGLIPFGYEMKRAASGRPLPFGVGGA